MCLKGGDPSFVAVSQYCSMVLSRNPARSSHYPSVPVEMQVHLSLAARSEAAGGVAWTRAYRGELIVAAPLISPVRKPSQTGPEGRGGGSPIKKCSRKRAAHCHWVHFVSLCSWHRNSSCGEAAAYPQALRCMWHFGCKAVRPPLSE